jgi:hypothetical protein
MPVMNPPPPIFTFWNAYGWDGAAASAGAADGDTFTAPISAPAGN